MFYSSVSEEVGLFCGTSMCLYVRHAWGCIIVAIVLGLSWSANSLSAEEHKFIWLQMANCLCGRVYLSYVVGQQKLYKNYSMLYGWRRSNKNRFSLWICWLVLMPIILQVISDSTLHFQHYSCPVRMRQWGDQWAALSMLPWSFLPLKDHCVSVNVLVCVSSGGVIIGWNYSVNPRQMCSTLAQRVKQCNCPLQWWQHN